MRSQAFKSHHVGMPRRKIIHIIDSMADGGTQEFMLNYLNFSSLADTEVYLVEINEGNAYKAEIKALSCRHIVINGNHKSLLGRLNPYSFWKLCRLLRRIRPDILHARLHLSLLFGVLPAILAGVNHVLYTIESSFTQTHGVYKFLVKFLSKWMDCIFTGYIHEYRDASLPLKKYKEYKVCLNFEQCTLLDHEQVDTKVVTSGPNLASVGRLHRDKGHQYAIEALYRLKPKYPEIRLFVAGTGPFRNELQRLVKSYSLEKNVVFCGFVKNIEQLWKRMDLCLQCTVKENLNLSSLWALSVGIPVVTFAIPSMADQIDVEKYRIGMKADHLSIDDMCLKIESLIESPEIRSTLSANAVRFVKSRYDARTSAAYYDSIYQELFKKK
jgi:glycosyltransferase involved in cell wall biosynthesis